jgi:hypothetical protein
MRFPFGGHRVTKSGGLDTGNIDFGRHNFARSITASAVLGNPETKSAGARNYCAAGWI